MKTIAIVCLLSIASCSLLEKRREDLSFNQGAQLEEVKNRAGAPSYESMDGGETILTYDYCRAPMWKEAVFGVLTATMYNWNCHGQKRWLQMYFNDGKLYKVNDAGTSPSLVQIQQK